MTRKTSSRIFSGKYYSRGFTVSCRSGGAGSRDLPCWPSARSGSPVVPATPTPCRYTSAIVSSEPSAWTCSASVGQARGDGAADLTRGDGLYAGLAIGLVSGLPPLARSGPSQGFHCQIHRGPGDRLDFSGLRYPPFAPADRHWPGRSGASARATARAPSRRRVRPGGPPWSS